MARLETFQMSVDWLPERPPAVRMAARDCAGRACSIAKKNYCSCISPGGNRPRAAGYGITAAVLYSVNPGAPKVCSCSRFTRLLLVQLIFLVTDRSRNHGHAP